MSRPRENHPRRRCAPVEGDTAPLAGQRFSRAGILPRFFPFLAAKKAAAQRYADLSAAFHLNEKGPTTEVATNRRSVFGMFRVVVDQRQACGTARIRNHLRFPRLRGKVRMATDNRG